MRPPRSRPPPLRAATGGSPPSAGLSPPPPANSCLEELALEEDSWLDRRLPTDLQVESAQIWVIKVALLMLSTDAYVQKKSAGKRHGIRTVGTYNLVVNIGLS